MAKYTFKAATYPEGKAWICQGLSRDVCTQGKDREEAVTRWQVAMSAELSERKGLMPPMTPGDVKHRALNTRGHLVETITVEVPSPTKE